MVSGGFGFRTYTLFDTLVWIACLNVLWVLFTILGGVVLGIGPSTAAAHVLVRDKVRGNATPLVRRFAKEYVKNFAKGNALGWPLIVVGAALVLNWGYFSAGWDFGSQIASAGILLAALIAAGTACYLFPMFARYELSIPQYFLMSSRFAMRHLAGTVILLFVTAAALFVCRSVPGLIPFFGVGAWLYVTGWLCDRFFAANDEAMSESASGPSPAGSAAAGSPPKTPTSSTEASLA
ncbi:putative membrane protein YesL [Paenarthrobacter sp. TE4293]|uniref:YesL family protein n=1 Tax=Paenarthrobacter sp. TE4293 TaxID=3381695 RepID=UPI003D1E8176